MASADDDLDDLIDTASGPCLGHLFGRFVLTFRGTIVIDGECRGSRSCGTKSRVRLRSLSAVALDKPGDGSQKIWSSGWKEPAHQPHYSCTLYAYLSHNLSQTSAPLPRMPCALGGLTAPSDVQRATMGVLALSSPPSPPVFYSRGSLDSTAVNHSEPNLRTLCKNKPIPAL